MKTLIFILGIGMLTPITSSANDENNLKSSAQDVSQNANQKTVQDIDGNTYRTVKIGEQIWLAENLRVTKYQDGTKINTGFIPNDKEE
ncbi:MAG: hypothetical protein ABJH28_21335, partial [Paraglaciecola sp.]